MLLRTLHFLLSDTSWKFFSSSAYRPSLAFAGLHCIPFHAGTILYVTRPPLLSIVMFLGFAVTNNAIVNFLAHGTLVVATNKPTYRINS